MEDFVYDKENHLGYYKGELVPSITQLLELDYPLGNIKEEVLKQASERGTFIHSDIEQYNIGALERCNSLGGINYQRLVKTFNLGVFDTENQVFIKNESGEIIAYGTFDLILKADEDSLIAKKGEIILADIKTVSQFDNEKVSLQTSMYALAYEQMGNTTIDKVCGIWVRCTEKENITQIRVLERLSKNATYVKVLDLVARWKERLASND